MELVPIILNTAFRVIGRLDNYISLTWTDRYCAPGDFEIVCSPPDAETRQLLTIGNFVHIKQSEHYMMIETIEYTQDIENGEQFTISGRSLEQVLHNRVWDVFKRAEGPLEQYLEEAIDTCLVDHSSENLSRAVRPTLIRTLPRYINNFSIDRLSIVNTLNTFLAEQTIAEDVEAPNLGEWVESHLYPLQIGYRIVVDIQEDDISKASPLTFQLYTGTNRSEYNDSTVGVTFSSKFENLFSARLYNTMVDVPTNALVIGEGEHQYDKTATELDRYTRWVGLMPTGSMRRMQGWARVEATTNSSQTRATDDPDNPLPVNQYEGLLGKDGNAYLAENSQMMSMDADTDPNGQYQFGRDYFLGDLVNVVLWEAPWTNEAASSDSEGETQIRSMMTIGGDGMVVKSKNYSYTMTPMVTAVTFTSDVNGVTIYPTFE